MSKKLIKRKKKKLRRKCQTNQRLRRFKTSRSSKLNRKVVDAKKKSKQLILKPKKLVHKSKQLVLLQGNDTTKMSLDLYRQSRDKAGVKRLFSPFNKFHISRPKSQIRRYVSDTPTNGLTSKERSYLLCSCQSRFSRYTNLKRTAAEAVKNNKIFLIHGYCDALRKALIERGWVEKIPPNRLDFEKLRSKHFSDPNEMHRALEKLLLSNLVEKCIPNFVWNAREDYYDNFSAQSNIIYNRLRAEAQWTTKQGLCESSKNQYWYYIEDVAAVHIPRTYTSSEATEREDFEEDYKLTACTSLLKWVLSMVANDRPIFSETGGIAINVIVFALNRCKEYLFFKQNKDIDQFCTKTMTSAQWNSFFKKNSALLSKEDVFILDTENKLPLYLGYAKFLLKEIYKYRPQLSCEGCHNIWIIKPTHCSRGRGIKMASKLTIIKDLLNRGNHVCQKYIEEPLLIHGTKFDIRQYYLVTNTRPLVIWMYKDCYLKFSSQNYSLKNYHESIHLTNNAVQKKYKNCQGRHPEMPEHNMWSLETYKDYLRKIDKDDVWETKIYPEMKKAIISTMLSCQENMSYSKNRFELYGCDFILDKDFKPWLIEINSSPDLNPTTPVTAEICSAVISDIVKVVVDLRSRPKASTGKFECIYRQTITSPRYTTGVDLTVRGRSLPIDYFYRGSLDIFGQNLDVPNMGKQQNIDVMLRKMKGLNENDIIMVQPESSNPKIVIDINPIERYILEKKESNSDENVNEAAKIITNQLDDLLQRIPSQETSVARSMEVNKRHLAEIKQLDENKRTSSRISSVDDKVFTFSELNDGPRGKGSGSIHVFAIETISTPPKESSIIPVWQNPDSTPISNKWQEKQVDFKRITNNVEDATKKLLDFLDKKAKEYDKYA